MSRTKTYHWTKPKPIPIRPALDPAIWSQIVTVFTDYAEVARPHLWRQLARQLSVNNLAAAAVSAILADLQMAGWSLWLEDGAFMVLAPDWQGDGHERPESVKVRLRNGLRAA